MGVKPPTVIMGGPAASKFPPMVGGFKGPLPMELNNLEAEEDRTEKVGGPAASKFGDEVGSGLPPGASVRGPLKLLEEREGMSMVQLRGQERDEDEVDDEMDKKKKKKKKNIRKKVRDEMKREQEKKNDVKKQVKKLTKDLPKPHPVIGANSWLPKPYFKPQPKPFFFPEEEMIVCPPGPIACVFPPEMLNRPEAISCGEGLIICKPPEQEFVKPPTVIMGGPAASKFGDEVGSGLPPGASVRGPLKLL